MQATRKAPKRPVTLSALAKNLGLSAATVSFVLNGNAKRHRIQQKTVQRVLKAAEKHGYVANEAARYLKKQRTGMIGVILGDISHDRAYFTTKGMLPALETAGFTPFISTSFWDIERHTRQLLSFAERRAEGLICDPFPEAVDAYRQIMRHGTPLLFLGDSLDEMPDVSSVAWDAAAAAKVAVRHLIDLGRRRIGFVGHNWPTHSGRAMHRAYLSSLAGVGLSSDPAWSMQINYPQTVEQFVVNMLSRNTRPDAFFATNDAIAMSLLAHLELQGLRVPDDIAVVGMGNFPMSSAYGGLYGAGLTSVRKPLDEIGRICGEVMLELIGSPNSRPVQRKIRSSELLVRRTTVAGRNDIASEPASVNVMSVSVARRTDRAR